MKNEAPEAAAAREKALAAVYAAPHVHLLHLYPAIDPALDAQIEKMAAARAEVACRAEVRLSRRGLLNCKKISYSWQGDWIGSRADGYAGLRKHVKKSIRGRSGPVRVYVLSAPDIAEMVALKAEIRDLVGLGTWPCHITDTAAEAVALAEIYFNPNALLVCNGRDPCADVSDFDAMVDGFKARAAAAGLPLDAACGAGSTPLAAMGVRKSRDFDFLAVDPRFETIHDSVYSPHDSQLRYYPFPKEEIISNPSLHFKYRGVKLISPAVAAAMKRARGEWPKDWKDVARIGLFAAKSRLLAKTAWCRWLT